MGPHFDSTPGADGWQLSNPPILALAPLRVSLDVFHRAGMHRLREKSIALTGYFADLVRSELANVIDIATPLDAGRRGCQLSLRVRGPREAGRSLFDHLNTNGIVVDWREPDVIRAAPTPLYNSHADCLDFVAAVSTWAARG
jgi:kynureninase